MAKKKFFKSSLARQDPPPKALPTPQVPDEQSARWIEQALQKANTAVLFDYTSAPKQALDAYQEAVDLLDKVFRQSDNHEDHTRLQKIYATYRDRIVQLRQQLTDADLVASPLAIPIAAPAPILEISTPTSASPPPPPPPAKDPPKPAPSISSSSSRFRRPSTATVDSSRSVPTNPPKKDKLPPKSPSIFATMFQKREAKSHPSPPLPSNASVSSSFFNMAVPSKSTPTLSLNRPSFTWKKQNKKKNRHSIELEAPPSPTQSTLTLTLPEELTQAKPEEDYFDLHMSEGTRQLLYAQPTPVLESMRDLHDKHDKPRDSLSSCTSSASSLSLEEKLPMQATPLSVKKAMQATPKDTLSQHPHRTSPPPTRSASSKMQHTNSTVSHSSNTSTPPTLASSASSIMTTTSVSTSPPPTQARLPTNLAFSTSSFLDIQQNDVSFSSMFTNGFLSETDDAMDNLAKLLADTSSHPTSVDPVGPAERALPALPPSEPAPWSPPAHLTMSMGSHPLSVDTVMAAFAANTLPTLPLQDHDDDDAMTIVSTTASTVATRDDPFDVSSLGSLPSPTPTTSTTGSKQFWFKRNKSIMRSKRPNALHIHPPLQEHDDALTEPGSPPVPTATTSTTKSAPATPRTFHFKHNPLYRGVDMTVAMDSHTNPDKQPKLMARLLQSMQYGGYITDRIHAPKELWYQTHLRVPAIEAKLSTTDQLLVILQRMQTRNLVDHHHCLYDLGCLEQVLDQIRQSFGKASAHANSTHPAQPASSYPSDQLAVPSTQPSSDNDTLSTWSSKFSKSMERMKLETTAVSSSEQVTLYIETLMKIFALAYVFDDWRNRYMELSQSMSLEKSYLYDHLLQKTMMCTGTFHSTVCGFVMRDFNLFLSKWIKRSKDWILDD
ncbi:hypothetical protein DM01DRAFT_1406346 [Hesseltinella vesiculosa]|uniref:MIT domain-containing protein n=1 Tax=Hesseltinella vesiculosa TaxID=101127 RepID=A0A1X2GM91_9FUNG|nr:hypothetical protein DM01DRAFT_1406346 [Hesseltinella vesiculosa]